MESKDPVDVSLYNRGSVKEKKLRFEILIVVLDESMKSERTYWIALASLAID